VYAIESSEHMEDKQRFFDEAYRTLRPGGRLGVYAWLACEHPHPWEVRYLLEPICREGRLPSMGARASTGRWLLTAGFDIDEVEDLSRQVRRTWSICVYRVAVKLLTQSRYRRYINDKNASNRVFALSLIRLLLAYQPALCATAYSLRRACWDSWLGNIKIRRLRSGDWPLALSRELQGLAGTLSGPLASPVRTDLPA
jgi:hypothetical protein